MLCLEQKNTMIHFTICVDDAKIVEKSVDFFVVNFYEKAMIKLSLNQATLVKTIRLTLKKQTILIFT